MRKLDDSNFLLYAAANYQNSQYYNTDEFYEDLNRFKYLKKLLYRYHNKDELRIQLILNHLITLYNVFTPSACTRMLFYRTDKQHWYILKTFLLYLGYMPDYVEGVEDELIRSDEISVDLSIVKELRDI